MALLWHQAIIDRLASLRVLGMCFLLTLLFPLLIFPWMGFGDEQPMDRSWSYSARQVYAYLDALGAAGRSEYLRWALSADLVFPVIYSFMLFLALTLACRRTTGCRGWIRKGRYLPLLIIVADWSENVSLAVVAYRYPERLDVMAQAASLFTTTKWMLIGGSLLLLVIMVLFRRT